MTHVNTVKEALFAKGNLMYSPKHVSKVLEI